MGKPDEDIVEHAAVQAGGQCAQLRQGRIGKHVYRRCAAADSRQAVQRMDTYRARTGAAVAGNGHGAYRTTVHARTSAAHHRGAGNTMTPCFAE